MSDKCEICKAGNWEAHCVQCGTFFVHEKDYPSHRCLNKLLCTQTYNSKSTVWILHEDEILRGVFGSEENANKVMAMFPDRNFDLNEYEVFE